MQKQPAPYFIGLDIGTSSTKAVAFTVLGEVIAQRSGTYELEHPEPEAAVQDPDLVCRVVLESLREVIRETRHSPLAVGLSSAMHSLLAVDRNSRPLTPLITWADSRSRLQAEGLKGSEPGKYIYQHTGTPIHAMTPLNKLAWLKQEHPAIFRQAHRFVGIKDYLLFQCFGGWWVDHSLASATGLFDLKKRQWLPEALAFAGTTAERLPQPVPVRKVFSSLSPKLAETLELPEGIPWVIGGSDGCLANLGAGILNPEEAVLTIGTSAAVRMTVPEAVYDPLERLFCYIMDDQYYVIGGASNNGGVVWEWFYEQFFPDLSMDEILRQVAGIPPGAGGLLFLPYVFGERAPVWDASARGHFRGIGPTHTRVHFARAVLEGICLNLLQITEALESAGGPVQRIYANGGFAQSDVWVQMLTDILGKEVVVGANPHASAWGAAILAMQAIGHQPPPIKKEQIKTFRPNIRNSEQYREIYQQFRQIYPSARVS